MKSSREKIVLSVESVIGAVGVLAKELKMAPDLTVEQRDAAILRLGDVAEQLKGLSEAVFQDELQPEEESLTCFEDELASLRAKVVEDAGVETQADEIEDSQSLRLVVTAQTGETPSVKHADTRQENAEKANNLQLIDGIDADVEALLQSEGIFRFEQIAAFGMQEVTQFSDRLNDPYRVSRENWIEQATLLSADIPTKYSSAFFGLDYFDRTMFNPLYGDDAGGLTAFSPLLGEGLALEDYAEGSEVLLEPGPESAGPDAEDHTVFEPQLYDDDFTPGEDFRTDGEPSGPEEMSFSGKQPLDQGAPGDHTAFDDEDAALQASVDDEPELSNEVEGDLGDLPTHTFSAHTIEDDSIGEDNFTVDDNLTREEAVMKTEEITGEDDYFGGEQFEDDGVVAVPDETHGHEELPVHEKTRDTMLAEKKLLEAELASLRQQLADHKAETAGEQREETASSLEARLSNIVIETPARGGDVAEADDPFVESAGDEDLGEELEAEHQREFDEEGGEGHEEDIAVSGLDGEDVAEADFDEEVAEFAAYAEREVTTEDFNDEADYAQADGLDDETVSDGAMWHDEVSVAFDYEPPSVEDVNAATAEELAYETGGPDASLDEAPVAASAPPVDEGGEEDWPMAGDALDEPATIVPPPGIDTRRRQDDYVGRVRGDDKNNTAFPPIAPPAPPQPPLGQADAFTPPPLFTAQKTQAEAPSYEFASEKGLNFKELPIHDEISEPSARNDESVQPADAGASSEDEGLNVSHLEDARQRLAVMDREGRPPQALPPMMQNGVRRGPLQDERRGPPPIRGGEMPGKAPMPLQRGLPPAQQNGLPPDALRRPPPAGVTPRGPMGPPPQPMRHPPMNGGPQFQGPPGSPGVPAAGPRPVGQPPVNGGYELNGMNGRPPVDGLVKNSEPWPEEIGEEQQPKKPAGVSEGFRMRARQFTESLQKSFVGKEND